jgi:hypothetical protein
MAWTEEEIAHSRSLLGVPAGASSTEVEQAYLRRSYALLHANGSDEDKEQLKLAREALLEVMRELEQRQLSEARVGAEQRAAEMREARLVAEFEQEEEATKEKVPVGFHPASFDNALVNAVVVPAIAALGVLASVSPLNLLLNGYYVWVHEFGHATVAWLTGRRALPLPFGWTNISEHRSAFVCFGLLFLFAVLFIVGARERKIFPVAAAVVLAFAQFVMTWRWPENIGYKWSVFAGVGGEFYLSAATMALFYFRLPQKMRWGVCRYFFLFIGAGSFFRIWSFWQKVKRGEEGIPYGSMIGGEDDEGGDMNILHDDFDWSQHDIVNNYHRLGTACLWALAIVYVFFALRLDRWPRRWLARAAQNSPSA